MGSFQSGLGVLATELRLREQAPALAVLRVSAEQLMKRGRRLVEPAQPDQSPSALHLQKALLRLLGHRDLRLRR